MSRAHTLRVASRVVWGLGAVTLVGASLTTLLGVEPLYYPIAIAAVVTIVGGQVLAALAERERELDDYILREELEAQGLPAPPEPSIDELTEHIRRVRRRSVVAVGIGLALMVVGILFSPYNFGFIANFGQWIAGIGFARHLVARLEAGSVETIAREREARDTHEVLEHQL